MRSLHPCPDCHVNSTRYNRCRECGMKARAGKKRGPYANRRPLVDRILERSLMTGGHLDCIEWQGTKDKRYGYGSLQIAGKTAWVHRVAYELFVADIPSGLTVDHLCANPSCINPFHLDVCTQAENMKRMHARRGLTHCKHGHPLSGANLYVEPKRGTRQCVQCRRDRDRARYARNRDGIPFA